MVTIVLANHKGGVGKTTSVLNIGDALVARGFTVLLIDGDQQANLSDSFAYTPPPLGSLAAVLRGLVNLGEAVQEVRPGLYLLPAGPDLDEAVAERAKQPGAELALRKLLAPLTIDYTLIDTPGALGKLTDMALTAATAVFIPVHPEGYGMAGLVKLIVRCRLVEENLNPGLRVAGLFLTQYHPNDRRVIMKKNVEDMRSHPILEPLLMMRTIRDNVAVKEAQNLRRSLFTYAPDCAAAVDYTLLTAEILARLNPA